MATYELDDDVVSQFVHTDEDTPRIKLMMALDRQLKEHQRPVLKSPMVLKHYDGGYFYVTEEPGGVTVRNVRGISRTTHNVGVKVPSYYEVVWQADEG